MALTGQELVRALQQGRLERPIVVTGLVKEEETQDHVLFSPSQVRTDTWISIPADRIAAARVVGRVQHGQHSHPLVVLELVEPDPDNSQACLYAALLRGMSQGPA